MPLAASRSPPKPGPAVGAVLVPGCMSALPKVDLAEVSPPGPRLDEPSWRCRQLWLAALQTVLNDARGRGFGSLTHRHLAMHTARAWLRRPSADRAQVLALAGIDLDAFVSRGLPHLEQLWRQLDERHQILRYEHGFSRVSGRRRAA